MPPAEPEEPENAGGESSSSKKTKKTKKNKPPGDQFGSYIYKVLKQVHPKMKISKQAMGIMDSCVNDSFEKIALEASRLLRNGKAETMKSRDIQSAVRLVFPGELARHAVSEGCKAVMKYVKHTDEKKQKKKKGAGEESEPDDAKKKR